MVKAVVELVSCEGGGIGGVQARDDTESAAKGAGGGGGGGAKGPAKQAAGGAGGGAGGSCKLQVKNLPRGIANEADLRSMFEAAGPVASAAVGLTKAKSKVGVVVMANASAAANAVAMLDGADMNGRALSVRLT